MAKKKLYRILYKYAGEPWREYDQTLVPNWAVTQAERCHAEHPHAQVEIQPKVKR
jgi:hypothetical protein